MMKSGLLILGAAAASGLANAATCGEALQECERLCSTRGFVEKQECWGEPDSCVICLCQDGSDLTEQLPVRCTLDYCGYDCPSYEEEKACSPNYESCGDWGVPCCHDNLQICDYTDRNPNTGEGVCRDLACVEETIAVTGLPDWHYFPESRFNLNGAYTLKAEHGGEAMGYAKYQREVDGYIFSIYPYAAGSGNLGWTLFCESCGFLWLVYSPEFEIDITATDPFSWTFQGNGGTQICGDPAVGQCWHDSNTLSGIQIACGGAASFDDANTTRVA